MRVPGTIRRPASSGTSGTGSGPIAAVLIALTSLVTQANAGASPAALPVDDSRGRWAPPGSLGQMKPLVASVPRAYAGSIGRGASDVCIAGCDVP